MPKPNKKSVSNRSPASIKLISFNSNISDIINKFENTQKSCIEPYQIKNPIIRHKNNYDKSIISTATSIKKRPHRHRFIDFSESKMCESINDSDIDYCNNNNHCSEPLITTDTDQLNDIIEELFDDDNDECIQSNDFNYVKINGNGGNIQKKSINFNERLRNINIVRCQLNFFQRFIGILLSFPFFSSINGAGLSTLTCAFFLPRILCENILYPIFRLILGTLYPAYASYKAVRNKDVKDYVSMNQFLFSFTSL